MVQCGATLSGRLLMEVNEVFTLQPKTPITFLLTVTRGYKNLTKACKWSGQRLMLVRSIQWLMIHAKIANMQ